MINSVDIVRGAVAAYVSDAESARDIDLEKLSILETYCTAIDELHTKDGVSVMGISAEVDLGTGKVIIGIECDSVESYPDCYRFKALMSRAERMDIKMLGIDDIEIAFRFPSLWVE